MKLDWIPLAMMAALWLFFLWQPYMRTVRSVAFLTVMSAAFVGSYVLPGQLHEWVQVALAAGTGVILVFFYRSFVTLPARDLAFLDAIDAANQRLQSATRDFEQDPSGKLELRQSLEAAMADVAALDPPDLNWAAVQSGALALLRRRLQLLDQEEVNPADRQEFARQRADLHQRVERARSRRQSFWRSRG